MRCSACCKLFLYQSVVLRSFNPVWFTIAPMLQDLDQITARIGQVVDRNRQLKAERDRLRVQLDEAERTSRKLREQCGQRDAALLALQEKMSEQDGEIVQKLAVSQASEGQLREQLSLQLASHEALTQALAAKAEDVERLKRVTVEARSRIDAVLSRLPGSPVAEEV